jgi:hypothetical protein
MEEKEGPQDSRNSLVSVDGNTWVDPGAAIGRVVRHRGEEADEEAYAAEVSGKRVRLR